MPNAYNRLGYSSIYDLPYFPYNEGEILTTKLEKPFEDHLTIDPTTIIDSEGNQLFPNGLCKVGDIYDEIDLKRGVAIKRVGSVDLGDLTWVYSNAYDIMYAIVLDKINTSLYKHVESTKYYSINGVAGSLTNASNKLIDKSVIGSYNTSRSYVFIKDSSFTTDTDLKTALKGVMLYYELAELIEVPISMRSTYRVANGGTEKIVADKPTLPFIGDIAYRSGLSAELAINMLADAAGI